MVHLLHRLYGVDVPECPQIMCAKYYELRYMFLKCSPSKLARLLDATSKFALFSVSGLKDEKLI